MKTFFLTSYFEIQSTLITLREVLVSISFTYASKGYTFFKTGEVWTVHTRQLLSYPKASLGYHLGCFLLQNKFELQPRCEDHDVFHVLTGYQVTTNEEIAMQFWLWGNGKRSPFVLLAICVGLILYLDQYRFVKNSFDQGLKAAPIHHLDFKQFLSSPIDLLKARPTVTPQPL